ncbi:class I SAM-dependent methyltransferase [Alkalihalobacillus sp. R86527]|uniref:class I SAM-dependent methyltransferase n=1 Tax=Alkalihalobacillus sp. R86527 TaxID=3093863 RepID=UPI0036727CE1
MKLIKPVQAFIDRQYSRPTGIIGMVIGEKMVRQHKLETTWTIEKLNVREDELILELGCGAGLAINMLQSDPAVQHVTGYDFSPTVLKRAKLRNQQAINKGKVTLNLGNVNALPHRNHTFTKVFSIHSIYFWEDLTQTIDEIYRVLKPAGTVVLTLCNGKNDILWDGIKKKIEEEVIPSMETAGFDDIELLEGPRSRGYHTIAVRGIKHSS